MAKSHSPADAWEAHARWYDQHHGKDGDQHHQQIIIPAILRHLALKPGLRVLDCCCGQGVVARSLVAQGAEVFGVDGSPSLIKQAQSYAGTQETYHCGDAHDLSAVLGEETFDAAVCVLAAQDFDPLDSVFTGIAQHVAVGGELVLVLTHPCFRVPRHSDWFFERKRQQQHRQVSHYLSPLTLDIQVGHGESQSNSTHYHRPMQSYLRSLGTSGFAVIDAEELCVPFRGSTGKHSQAEVAAHREFPTFLLLHAKRI